MSGQGDVVGLALGFVEKSPRRLLAPLTGRLWTDSGVVAETGVPHAANAFARELEAYARRRKLSAMVLGSLGGDGKTSGLEQLRFAETRYWEFTLDLSASEGELWSKMEVTRRQKLRKAERMRIALGDLGAVEGVSELRRLQAASSARIVARGGPDIAYKGGRPADPIAVLLDSGLSRIVCAKLDGRVISASLFTCFNGLVYHTFSGHSEEALRTQAPTFLLWETIKRYKAEGASRFNFGGCRASAVNETDPEHGVYVYKRRDLAANVLIASHSPRYCVRCVIGRAGS